MASVAEILPTAIAYHQNGRFIEAEKLYRQILALHPENARVLHLLGVLTSQTGNLKAAIAMIQQAIALAPNEVTFQSNLGMILTEFGSFEAAIETLERALRIDAHFAESHNNLGNAWLKLGQLETATACYRQAIVASPTFAVAHFNLGNVLRLQGLIEPAIAAYQASLLYSPDFAEAHNNLGIAFSECRRFDIARKAFEKALQFSPHYAEAYKNLGNCWMEEGQYDRAVVAYRQAAHLSPALAELSLAYSQQHICDWRGLEALAKRIIATVDDNRYPNSRFPVSPFAFLCLPIPTTAIQQLRCARVWAQQKYSAIHMLPTSKPVDGLDSPRAKIRIGYLSADFHAHATANLAVELFEFHDRQRFEVFGYSIGPADMSPMRQRLVTAFDEFHDLQKLALKEMASKIASDGIDILVDLKGYTQNCRPEILAHRPSPIQVSYLGYPGSMGAKFIDYLIVDNFVVPPAQQACFSEKLVSLPGCYQVNTRLRDEPAQVPTRAECGLPEAAFVFCSFNDSYKLTPRMFDLWMRLLGRIPNSYLWLLEGNGCVSANLGREAETRGVPANRLVFAPRKEYSEHLIRLPLADLFLDCFPVNAHTSASDSLRMGLPLLTLSGETFISRVAGSLLHAVGLPELVASTFDEYEAIALRLANDRDALRQLREKLVRNRKVCPLFDCRAFARKIEKAYQSMWQLHQRGQSPTPFSVE